MRISYLQANQAWALTFGDSLVSLDDRFLWSSRKDLVNTLKRHGLQVGPGGRVTG